MFLGRSGAALALFSALLAVAAEPKLPGIGMAMRSMVEQNEIAGAVTVVVTKNKLVHLETTGYADVSLGAKWHMQDGDEARGRPGIAWLMHVDVDSGSAAFRGQGLRPSLRVAAEWDLPGDVGLGVMPGVFLDRNAAGERYVGAIFASVLSKSLTERLRGFVEVAASQLASARNGGNMLTFDTGLAYLIGTDMQVDVAMARGLSKAAPDFAWTVGWSMRF